MTFSAFLRSVSLLKHGIFICVFRQLNIEEIYGIIKLPDKGNKRVRSAIKMKKALSFITGAIYSLGLFILYRGFVYWFPYVTYYKKLLIISPCAVLLMLLLCLFVFDNNKFCLGAVIGCIPAVILILFEIVTEVVLIVLELFYAGDLVSVIDWVNNENLHAEDLLVFILKHSMIIFIDFLVIYFVYTITNLKKIPIKELLFAIGYCLIIVVFPMKFVDMFETEKLTWEEWKASSSMFVLVVLPIILYVFFLLMNNNKKVYRALLLGFWVLLAIPYMYSYGEAAITRIRGITYSELYYALGLPLHIIAISLVDHVIALIISEHKKAPIKE